jgi:integrase
MASIAIDPGGRRRILFVAPDESRKAIRLGRCDRKTAEAITRHVEALLAAKIGGQPIARDTAVWLAGISESLREKLARAGLVEGRQRVPTFDELAAAYQARPDIKASTKAIRAVWTRAIVGILGDIPINRVTAQDAGRLRDALAVELAPPTVGRMLRFARQVLELGVQRGELARNPLATLKHNYREGTGAPRDDFTVEETDHLLEACPPAWRVLIGLARYGALRCPSEGLLVRWADVDLPGRQLIVRSPKTEAQGKGWRVVPITP